MYTVLAIIIVIASIFLTIIVLVQNDKGGGLAANFASGNQTFGVRQTADFLEKATWTLVAIVLVCSILATAFVSTKVTETKTDLTKELQQQAPAGAQPQFPTSGGAQQSAPAGEQAPATPAK
jgi:preprotein translocase subunit SecG